MYTRLVEHFSVLEDPRCAGKVLHRLIDILVIAVCAVVAGAESWEDIELYGKEKKDWLATFLELQNGIPSHDTFRRLFMIINPDAVEQHFLDWVASFSSVEQHEVVAIDGKTLRRSFDASKKQKPFHLLSAFSTRQGMTIGQRKVDGKSNEITAIPELLDCLMLKDSIVTIDAMGCQRAIAEKIIAQGADYILALKGNQKGMHEAVQSYCDEHCFRVGSSIRPTVDYFDESHGQLVRCRAFICPDACHLPALQQWHGLRQVLAVETIRHVANRDKTQCEIRYFLSCVMRLPRCRFKQFVVTGESKIACIGSWICVSAKMSVESENLTLLAVLLFCVRSLSTSFDRTQYLKTVSVQNAKKRAGVTIIWIAFCSENFVRKP